MRADAALSIRAWCASWRRRSRYAKLRKEEPELVDFLVHRLGVYPGHLDFYRVAFTHRGAPMELQSGMKVTNERLEYLGDAVLELIVSDFLFHRYPLRDEGQLTQLRSCIVCRKSFNQLSERIGLGGLAVRMSGGRNFSMRMKGDVLEAFFGALFLDVGFEATRRVFVDRVLKDNVDFTELEAHSIDPKSQVYMWAKKKDLPVAIEVIADPNEAGRFLAKVSVGEKLLGQGTGVRKKLAEQAACAQVCSALSMDPDNE